MTDPDATNNTATSTVTLTPIADMQVTKTGPTQATPGTNIIYTVTVTNAGPSDATGVVLNDVTPPGLTLVSVSGDCSRGFPCPVEPTFVAGAPPRTFTLTYAVPPGYTAPDPIANTATVSSLTADPQTGNNTATATTSIAGPVTDLGIAKTNGVTTVVPGQTVTYTITVTNAGPTDAVGAIVTDMFPAALTGVTWTCVGTGGGVCSPTGSGNINETVTVPVGGTVTFTATGTVSPAAVGVLVNTASVAPPPGASDPSSANNTDSDTLTPQADLSIAKTGPASVVAGTNVVYTITVTNAGPSNAESVVVDDATPAGLTFVSNTGDCMTAFPCALGTVPAARPRTITATFAVPLSYTTPDPIVNTATVVDRRRLDPVPANNTATVQTPLNRNADVEVTKTAPDTVLVGDTVAIAITALNHGPGAATGVEVTDVLPAGFQLRVGVADAGRLRRRHGRVDRRRAGARRPGAARDHGDGDQSRRDHERGGEDRPERARSEHEQRLGRHDHQRRSRGRRAGPQERRPQRRAGRRDRHLHRARNQPRPEPRDGGGDHRCAARRPDADHPDAIAGHL